MRPTDSIQIKPMRFSEYAGLIEKFLPFVLIRSVKYTNSAHIAKVIAVYTFVCSYYLALLSQYRKLRPIVIDFMTDIVGQDFSDRESPLNSELLFGQENVLNIAKVLGRLDTCECLCLVLYYIEKLGIRQIADISGKSFDNVTCILGRAQRLFIEGLGKYCPQEAIFSTEQIKSRLDCIADCLKEQESGIISDSVMDFLVRGNDSEIRIPYNAGELLMN